jgi:CheY-like chemotaxis protein
MRDPDVLVVEDDAAIRGLLVDYLHQRASLAVDTARDGVEALHQLSTHRYPVVVLDVMMPKMSGVDLLDSLQAMVADPSISKIERPPSVIVITSASDGVLPSETLQHRFPDLVRAVLRKPVDCDALATMIGEQIGR